MLLRMVGVLRLRSMTYERIMGRVWEGSPTPTSRPTSSPSPASATGCRRGRSRQGSLVPLPERGAISTLHVDIWVSLESRRGR